MVTLFFVLAILCIPILLTQSVPLTWSEVIRSGQFFPPAVELPGMGYYAAKNQIIVFGGRGRNGYSSALWICNLQASVNNTETCNWVQTITTNTPPARFSMVSGVYEKEGLFIVSTGEGSGRTHFNDIWYYDLNGGNSWFEVTVEGMKPSVRYGSVGGIHHEGSLFSLSHGFASFARTSDTFYINVTDMKSGAAVRWQLVSGPFSSYDLAGPHPRCLGAGTMISSKELVLFGGCLNSPLYGAGGPCPSFDSWKIDFSDGVWTRLPNCVSPRLYVAMAYLPGANGTAILFAGNTLGLRLATVASGPIIDEEIDVVDLKTDFVWTRRRAESVLGLIPTWREKHSMTSGNGKVYMFGGENSFSGEIYNDLWSIEGNYIENGDIGCPNHFFSILMMHGILMFLGWGVFLQAGAFIARYLRFKNPLWFHLHRFCQVTGLVIAIIGFILAFFQASFPLFWHGAFGIIVMIIGVQQPINAIFRPHIEKGKKTTLKRLIWSYFHIYSGRFALILALINITLGLFLILAPNYIWGTWFSMLIAFALLYIIFEIVKQYYDYQERKNNKNKIDGDNPMMEEVSMDGQVQTKIHDAN